MTSAEIDRELVDPFTQLVLKTQMIAGDVIDFPQTTSKVIEAFEKTKDKPGGMRSFSFFLVAEGVAERIEGVAQRARGIFSVTTKGGIGADVLISSGVADNGANLLELASWNHRNETFNFYQKIGTSWVYSGNSFHAHDPRAREKGPFSGHPTGGIIMKELRFPWTHWFSSKSPILFSVFEPNGPIPQEGNLPFITSIGDADTLELFVKGGNHLWNESKVRRLTSDNTTNFREYFRQLLETRNVNLTSSPDESRSIRPAKEVRLPATFFVNHFGLAFTGVTPDVRAVTVPGEIYLESLRFFDVSLRAGSRFIEGETHFAFLVPECAEEDISYLGALIRKGVISRRLAASLLMVDFSNPVYSSRRASLIKYIPEEPSHGDDGERLDERFIESMVSSGSHLHAGTPEQEFFSLWRLTEADWKAAFSEKLNEYMSKVRELCKTQEGFHDVMRLAVSRRRLFKKTPQSEFNLTLPMTNIPDNSPILRMDRDGRVLPVQH